MRRGRCRSGPRRSAGPGRPDRRAHGEARRGHGPFDLRRQGPARSAPGGGSVRAEVVPRLMPHGEDRSVPRRHERPGDGFRPPRERPRARLRPVSRCPLEGSGSEMGPRRPRVARFRGAGRRGRHLPRHRRRLRACALGPGGRSRLPRGDGTNQTVLACMAVLAGVPADEAVAWVRANYRAGAVETDAQKLLVARFGVDR